MPSRSLVHISSNSSRPLPSTESASETIGDRFGRIPCSRRRRSVSGKARRSVPLSQRMSKAATDAPGHSEQLVELWSTGLVGRDHLAVDYRFVNVEHGRHLVAERLEAAKDIAVARDEAAAAFRDITEAPEPIVLEVEEPIRVIERLLSPDRNDRLDAGKYHLADMARSAVFVHAAVPRQRRRVPSSSSARQSRSAAGLRCYRLCDRQCLSGALLRFSRSVMRRLKCPSDASSFSIRTKIRSSESAIVSSVTSLFSIRRRNGRRARHQRRSAAHCDRLASLPSRQFCGRA